MYLSRLTLDPRSRAVRRDLSDRYALHRTVMSGFPDAPGGRQELGVLFRLEAHGAAPLLYVQSDVAPAWDRLPEGYLEVDFLDGAPRAKPMAAALESIEAGRILRFRLQANPRKQLFKRGGRGPRVPLRRPDEISDWLVRRAAAAGFSVPLHPGGSVAVDQRPLDDVVGWQPRADGKRRRIVLGAVQLDGRLRVDDVARFRATLQEGIGSGRAFGLGLLSIAPAD